MVQLIVGNEGKGKSKELINKANEEILNASGNFVFLDRSSKHMFELNNKVRLIDISEYDFDNSSEFLGFIYGIISQDHDIEKMYIDGLMKIAKLTTESFEEIVKRFEAISNKFNFTIIVTASIDKSELSSEIQEKVIVAL